MLSAGSRNRRIRIEQRSATRDAALGSLKNEWTTFWEGWAEVDETTPTRPEQESEVQGARNALRRALIRTLWIDGVDASMRIIYLDRANRVLMITKPPIELGHKEGLEIMAVDYATQGAG